MLIDKSNFCKRIRQIRKDEHLTSKQLSQRSGINTTMISRIENGSFPTTITTIQRLQDGLKISNDHMLSLLGYENKKYKQVPVISEHVKNFGQAIAKAPNLAFVAEYTPAHCFIIKVCENMSPQIRKGFCVLVNRDFDYIDGDIYAILLDDKIRIGRVYKSKDKKFGVLVTCKHSYFNTDYKGQFTVLGQVVRIIDFLKPSRKNRH